MELNTIIKPDAVRILHGVTSKKRLFQAVSSIASPLCAEKQEVIVQALMDREGLGPTGVGNGVALPHARLHQTDAVFGCFAKLDKPVEFNSVDRQPVDLVFALFAPHAGGVDHLKALASVSRTLRDEAVREKLRANDEPATLYEILIGHQADSVAA